MGKATTPDDVVGVADLRVINGVGSFSVTDSNNNPVTIQRLTLEQSPTQPNGGDFNSTLSAGSIQLGALLSSNESINVEFILGEQNNGLYHFFVNIEASFDPTTPPATATSSMKASTKGKQK